MDYSPQRKTLSQLYESFVNEQDYRARVNSHRLEVAVLSTFVVAAVVSAIGIPLIYGLFKLFGEK